VRSPGTIVTPIVEIDGEPLPTGTLAMLSEVVVDHHVDQPAICSLRFERAEGVDHAFETLPGGALVVKADDAPAPLFEGDITSVAETHGRGGLRGLRVCARDRLHRLLQRQPVRVHLDLNLADLATGLVSADEIVVDSGPSGPVCERTYQFRQTDFDLLTERAASCGVHFALRGRTLKLFDLAGTGDEIELTLGENLFEASFENNADHAARRVHARAWDPSLVEARSGSSASPRTAQADPRGGPAVIGDEWQLLDEVVRADAEAEAMAQAELDYRAARRIMFSGTAAGDAGFFPGVTVRLAGVSPHFAGRYVVTRVRHSIDTVSGFVSSLWTAPPEPLKRRWSPLMTFGRVVRVEDPEKLGRVQVEMVAYGSLESGWLQVLLPAAGAGKGLIALPDVDDKVLVLLPREDPAHGVVLGGLYGSSAPPDAGVERGAVERYTVRTRGGQLIQLDDGGRRLRLENAQGSFVELQPDKVRVHAETDLEIEAPGHNVVIAGKKIDFRQA